MIPTTKIDEFFSLTTNFMLEFHSNCDFFFLISQMIFGFYIGIQLNSGLV